MNNKPIIGIVARPNEIVSGYAVLAIHENTRQAIVKAGGIPIMISPTQLVEYDKEVPKEIERLTDMEKDDLIRQIKLCDGIVMPGGFKFYEYDFFIANYVIDNNIPTLGLCMGMQLLAYVDNMRNGGVEGLLVKNETDVDHFQKGIYPVHEVNIMDDSLLKKVIGKDKLQVNSRHNYHVTRVNDAKICAISSDNLIEGIEFPDKKYIIGIQWHPESIINKDSIHLNVFRELINSIKK